MSGAPKVRSMNVTESETRTGLGLNANKPVRVLASDKQVSKTMKKSYKSSEGDKKGGGEVRRMPPSAGKNVTPIVSNQERILRSTYPMSASCSSDASSDSFHSRASTGGITRSNSVGESLRRTQCKLKSRSLSGSDNVSVSSGEDLSLPIKRCAWVTSNTGKFYSTRVLFPLKCVYRLMVVHVNLSFV